MAKKRKPHKVTSRNRREDVTVANPFELLHTKRRFDVLGKAARGTAKKTVKLTHARAAAVDKRKKSLLVEYKALKKSNAFIDRRFGEQDADMSPEDKALLRYQKQRSRELTKQQRFQLIDDGDGQTDILTHMGRSLADDDNDFFVKAASRTEDDDVLDDALADELVKEFHFGGGKVHEETEGADDVQDDETNPAKRRTKKEIMSEVIAKSKAAKAARQLQHEKDDVEVEKLNDALDLLLQQQKLAALFRPKGVKESQKADNAMDAAFDTATKELIFEVKAAPAERTLTEQEQAAKAAEAMQQLEQERRRRMIAGDSDEDVDVSEGPGGGYAARRKRQAAAEEQYHKRQRREVTGDADEDDFRLDSDPQDSKDEGGGLDSSGSDGETDSQDEDAPGPEELDGLTQRRRQRAAGDHPLQSSFRSATAALLLKHGVQPSKKALKDLQAQDEQGAGEEEEDTSGQGDSDDDVDDEGDSDGVDSGGATDDDSDDDNGDDDDGDDQVEEEGREGEATVAACSSSDDERVEGLDSLASDHDDEGQPPPCDPSSIVQHAVQRQRDSNVKQQQQSHAGAAAAAQQQAPGKVKLPGPLELPYTLPLPVDFEQYWHLVAGRSGEDVDHIIQRICSSNATELLADRRRSMQGMYGILVQHFALEAGQAPPDSTVLNSLTKHLAVLTPQVPGYAAKAAQARIEALAKRLQGSLKDPTQLPSSWPHPRALLLLRLWILLFDGSSKRHPVLLPAMYLMGAYLSLCPVTDGQSLAMGLYLGALLCQLGSVRNNVVPEPLVFAEQAILRFVQHSSPGATQQTSQGRLAQLSLQQLLSLAPNSAYYSSAEFWEAAMAAAVQLVASCAASYGDNAAAPELFARAVTALQQLAACRHISKDLQQLADSTAQSVRQACLSKERVPLVRAPPQRQADIKIYNPRFEDSYVASKDYDPDRERAEQRRMKRQLRKETRGAMRELRKDATFLYEVRERERAAVDAERTANFKRAMTLLHQQHNDLKSGGQGGMWNRNKNKKEKNK